MTLTGGDVVLTLHPGDEALALAYVRLLPLRLLERTIEKRPGAQPRLRVVADTATPAKPDLPTRIDAPEALMDHLSDLAARTYVPATEASRVSGAGAGDIDND